MSPQKAPSKNVHGASSAAGPDGARTWRVSPNGALIASVAALVLAALFVCKAAATMLSSALGAGTGEVKPGEAIVKLIDDHKTKMETYQARFNGRSVFFDPPAPKPLDRPKPPTTTPVVALPKEPEAPPISKTYPGPNIIYAIDDLVRFKPMTTGKDDKPLDIKVGEEVSGLRVISVDLPWSVKVAFKGGEYDVPIFARGTAKNFLVAQAKPVTLVEGLIVVEPPKPVVEAPTVTDAGEMETLTAAQEDSDEAEAQPKRGREARGAKQQTGSAQPVEGQAATRPQSPAVNEDEEEDEEAADEDDEATAEEDDDEAGADEEEKDAEEQPSQGGAAPAAEASVAQSGEQSPPAAGSSQGRPAPAQRKPRSR